MDFAQYTEHVQRALCWLCHEPTHRSHAAQRQCPNCRRKWSYQRRKIELELANRFATGFKAAEAARQCSVAYRTAWTHFLRFEQTARRAGCTLPLMRFSDDRKAGIRPPYGLERSLLEVIYTHLIEPNLPLPQLRPMKRRRHS